MNIQFQHPYPRYGFAAALVQTNNQLNEIVTYQDVITLAIAAINQSLNQFSVFTNDNPYLASTAQLRFDYLSGDILNPKKGDQTAKKGCYISPHVLTSDLRVAETAAEAKSIRQALLAVRTEDDLCKPSSKLKRSFAPLTAMVNSRTKEVQLPTTSLLQVAFTIIATLTELKPSVYLQYAKGKYSNAAIIADLPLKDQDDSSPLRDFIALFSKMQAMSGKTPETMLAKVNPENRRYQRPALHRGNFPNRPVDYSLNAVSLMAAIGEWVKANPEDSIYTDTDYVKRILHHLADRPLYIISYEFTRQERFSHYLVEAAFQYTLPKIQQAIYFSTVFGVEKKDDPKHKLFRTAATHFLQFFDRASFQDLMAFRGEYHAGLLPLFQDYFNSQEFMADTKISTEIIKSAKAFGQSINRAAYFAALNEVKEDQEKKRKGRTLDEYKARILTELEGRVDSATTHLQLLHQICVTVARMTGRDIDAQADVFMEAVAQSDDEIITLQQSKHLITAFMRLRYSKPKDVSEPNELPSEPEESEFALTEEQINAEHTS